MENNQELKEIIEEAPEIRSKKITNIKIYPIYRMLSWDLLFYYTIIYLFYVMEKGIGVSEVLQLDAYYLIFKCIIQIPCTMIIEKLGKRKALIIANFVAAMYILTAMLAPNFIWLVISQALCAFAFIIKNTCETDMLYDSIEQGEKRGVKFSRIEGRATSKFYYIDAISSVTAGFLFVVNPYIPLIMCFIILLIVFLISTKFEDIQQNRKKVKLKEEIKDVRKSCKDIFKSKRLVSLLLFNAVFVFMIKALQILRNTTLIEIGVEEQYFGIIFGVLILITGISTRNQGRIHKKYRNRTLSVLAVPNAISCLLMGILLLFNLPMVIVLPLLLILFAVQYIMKGPYYILIKQYLNNFTTSKARVRISTVNNLFENLLVSISVFAISFLVDYISISYSLIIIGAISLIVVVLLLDYMKKTVGKKPEEYTKKDFLKDL